MARGETVLAGLIRQRHLAREEVVEQFARVAGELGCSATLSLTQLDRLRFGALLTLPRPATVRVLERQFGRTIQELLAPDELTSEGTGGTVSPAAELAWPVAEEGDPTRRRDVFKAVGLGAAAGAGAGVLFGPGVSQAAAEAMEFTRRAERSEVGPSTLEHLDRMIGQFEVRYLATAPVELFGPAQWYRRRVAELADGRHTLREQRDLYVAGGWLSVILAQLSHDLGDPATAEAYCVDAWQHGWEAEHPELCGFAMDASATIALYDNRPAAALAAAVRGRAHAPTDTAAGVRLAAQEARAHARLGHADQSADALQAAQRQLPAVRAQGTTLFSVDAMRLESRAASASIWLGKPEQAITHAQHALALYDADPRAAVAHLDLGLASAMLGRPDEACAAGTSALASERVTGSLRARAGELHAVLTRRFPSVPEVIEFGQRYRSLAEPTPLPAQG